jgi:TRAP-type C4-dicarboxylate transport system permease small subunit
MLKMIIRFIKVTCTLILIVLLILIFSEIILRYFFSNSFIWLEEITRLLLAWFGFLGASLAIISNTHAKVDYFVNKITDKKKKEYVILGILLVCNLFFIFWSFYGIQLVIQQRTMPSPILGFPMSYQYLSVPVSGFIIVIDLSIKIIEEIKKIKSNSNK